MSGRLKDIYVPARPRPPSMNIYGEDSIAAYTPTPILENREARTFGLYSFIGWGDSPGEFLIYRNDVVVGGSRTSDQQRATQVSYHTSPIMFGPQDVLKVVAEHGSMGNRLMRVNVIGRYF